MSSYVYYLELHAICLWLLLWLLITIRRANDFQTGKKIYCNIIALCMIIIMLDVLKMWLNGVAGDTVHIVLNASCMGYTLLSSLICMGWVTFAVFKFRKDLSKNISMMIGLAVPHFILLVLSISSPWTQLLFYVDKHNLLHKGSLSVVQDIIVYGYFLATFIFMLYYVFKEIHSLSKRNRVPMIIPTISFFMAVALITYFVNGMDSLWPVFSVLLVFIHMDAEFGRISMDSLTGLNNRTYFDEQITRTTQSYEQNSGSLFLFMLDVDFFKKINDNYGHLEGDIALKQVAQVLREVCGPERTIIARYGGDEFACIYFCNGVEEAEKLKTKIYMAFEKRNESAATTYPISVSIGYAQFGVDGVYNDIELINKADTALYNVKKLTHRNTKILR